jgi:hypothetical protein
MASFQVYTAKRLTSGTTKVKEGPGVLAGISVNKALSGTVTVSDGATTIAVLTNGTTAPLGTTLAVPTAFASLSVALSGTEDITVHYM